MTHIKLAQLLAYTPIDSYQLADDSCSGKAWENASYIVSEFRIQGKCPINWRAVPDKVQPEF
jgi:hypothetical protein